jgi:hypothetical protein
MRYEGKANYFFSSQAHINGVRAKFVPKKLVPTGLCPKAKLEMASFVGIQIHK